MSYLIIQGLVLYTLFIAFLCEDGLVPFFARPALPFWIILICSLVFRIIKTNKLHNINNQIVAILAIYALSFLLIFYTHLIRDGIPNFGILPLYLSFIIYIVFFCTIFQNRKKELSKTLLIFIYVLIIAQTLASIVEFYLITNGMITWQDLWNKSNQHYLTTSPREWEFLWYRPLGIFGQFTMNGVIPIFAFLALVYVDKANYNITIGQIYRRHIILGLMVVINTVYSGSTAAYFFLLAVIVLILFIYLPVFYRFSFAMMIFIILIVLTVNNLTLSEFGWIGDQLIVNMEVMITYIEPYIVQGLFEQLFGMAHNESIASPDTNLLYLLSMLGILGLVVYLFTYGMLILVIRNLELRIFFGCIILGSLHYVALGNQAAHILVALVLTHYILTRKIRVVGGRNEFKYRQGEIICRPPPPAYHGFLTALSGSQSSFRVYRRSLTNL